MEAQDVLLDVGLILLAGVVSTPFAVVLRRRLTVLACLLPTGAVGGPGRRSSRLVVPRDGGRPRRGRGSAVRARGGGAEIVASMVAPAVVTTLLLPAKTAGALAQRLGLIETPAYVGAGR